MDLDTGSWPLDTQGYLKAIEEKARMFKDGHAAGLSAAEGDLEVEGLLMAGMGFSGVTANMVQDACTRSLDIPITVVKHYQFPRHVKPGWRTIALSYSGATEETLSVAQTSKERGVPVTAVTTGGALGELADVVVPQEPGYQPRAAFAFAWGSTLGYLEGSGLLASPVPVRDAVQAILKVDKSCGPSLPEANNPAKGLARRLIGKIPQIYATPALGGVGLHFRGMLNETAKKIADLDMVPECNHNDLMGWGGDPVRSAFAVVCLSHADQNRQMQQRLAYMRQRYEEWGIDWSDIQVDAIRTTEDHINAQAGLLQRLDYVAFYAAMLGQHDPSAIPEISGLKEYLRR